MTDLEYMAKRMEAKHIPVVRVYAKDQLIELLIDCTQLPSYRVLRPSKL